MRRLRIQLRKLSNISLFLISGLTVCTLAAFAQSASEARKDTALEERIAQTLKDYEKWKSDLEKTPEVIEGLKKKAQSPDRHLGGEGRTAQRLLAKLGESSQIQNLVCELYARDPQAQLDATQMLSSVGGYASIRALSRVILGGPAYGDRPPGYFVTLRMHALGALSALIPELKIPIKARFGIAPQEQQFRDWYDWIEDHRAQLGRLQPSDGGDLNENDCLRLQKEDFSVADIVSIRITTFRQNAQPSRDPDPFTILNQNGNFLIGNRGVEHAAITALVNAVTNPLEDLPNLADVGIDEHWLKSNARAALASLPPKIQTYTTESPDGTVLLTAEDKQEFLKQFTDMDRMNAVFRGNFFVLDGVRDGVNVQIKLRDGREIRLWSEGSELFLLPWAMQGKAYKEVFDYRLSEAIARLLPKDAPNVDRLSATGSYALRRKLALSLAINITSDCSKKECHTM